MILYFMHSSFLSVAIIVWSCTPVYTIFFLINNKKRINKLFSLHMHNHYGIMISMFWMGEKSNRKEIKINRKSPYLPHFRKIDSEKFNAAKRFIHKNIFYFLNTQCWIKTLFVLSFRNSFRRNDIITHIHFSFFLNL